ncbi:TetR/AcrR family transcriptional regulator [Bacillus sp. REN10]|uniref:TetR/AcrR family transcriptional regulator n=1 Tax=Bacillus sp. REN10 TaxID=2782541 RepID=UPI00193C79D3|nr:TetR/AcrR family transcriptional regulator [Bacillus sp. REN10]
MIDRKRQVIDVAHALFIEKGYAATSIQDILQKSNISKGTFYNYFSSKKELLMTIFEMIRNETNKRRLAILAGRSTSDKEAFMEQIAIKMKVNQENNLFVLFQGVFASEDDELKKVVKNHHYEEIQWLQKRVLELYGENILPYSLDLAVGLFGMVQNYIHFFLTVDQAMNIDKIIRYSMQRLEAIVVDVQEQEDQLLEVDMLNHQFSQTSLLKAHKKRLIIQTINRMLKHTDEEQSELLLFVQNEFSQHEPRRAVIHAILAAISNHSELQRYIQDYFEIHS